MHTKCGEIFNKHVAANILENLTVKKIQNWLRINRVTATSLVSPFLVHATEKNRQSLTQVSQCTIRV